MKQTDEGTAAEYDLDSLSQANLEKIHGTVMDIEDKLQVNPDPTVEIDWRFRNEAKTLEGLDDLECRIDALTFLSNWGIISSHNCNRYTPMTGEPVRISVNIPEFQKFKQKIAETYRAREAKQSSAGRVSDSPIKRTLIPQDTDVVYEVKFTAKREILVNDFLLTQLEFNSENDNVFKYLYEHSNRVIGLKELEKQLGGNPLKKSLHKIVENLGFARELKDAFFGISKTSILFRNPLARKELDSLGISKIRLPRR